MARHKRKGSSKSGRPRKEGDRYPSGKLKPRGPNATVLERRKAGDAQAGEHPMDFALSQKWVTESQHRAAMSYVAAFNRAHIGGPRMSNGSLCEVIPSEELRMNWSQLSDAEITSIFDQVFNSVALPGDRETIDAAALALWKRLNVALTPAERHQLFLVCVLGSWPFWMPKKAASHAMGVKDLLNEESLLSALGAVGRALRPAKPKPDTTIIPMPHRRTRAGRAEQAVRYETIDGEVITPLSEHGVAFEVSILRKRA